MPLPSFSNIPDLVVEKIVDKSDWKSVLTLRQVCRRLRYQVDHASESSLPNNKLTQLAIFVASDRIRTQFISSAMLTPPAAIHPEWDQISYVLQKNGGFLRQFNQGEPVEFESEHLVDMATNDLGRILKFQKWILKDFRLSFEKDMNQVFLSFPDAFNDILKSRNQTIKTETFDVCGYQSHQVVCMLPFLDPECLKCIGFRPPDETPIELNWGEIVGTYPWITTKEVHCYISGTVPLEITAQFSNLNLENSQSYTAQEIDYLKTAFSNSLKFVLFRVFYNLNVPSIEEQEALWGRAMKDRRNYAYWYFRMANSDEILEVMYYSDYRILISRMSLDRVPRGAVIRDN